jgi:hypothetical protein
MGVLVLASPGGSPGVTTAALALALTWPRPVTLAECDPAGGSVLSGLRRGQDDPGGARVPLALAAKHDPAAAAAALEAEAVFLGGEAEAMLLPSPPGLDAGRQLAGVWPAIATAFALSERDIIADVGRFDDIGGLDSLLASASQMLMVCRPTLRQAAAAAPRLRRLDSIRPADGLLLTGRGEYGPEMLARHFGVRVAGTLPWAPSAAEILSDGAAPSRRFIRTQLMRAARRLAEQLALALDTPPGPTPADARQQ